MMPDDLPHRLTAWAARPLRVLIGCECSGIVRRAFAARGHDVWSCDLKPAEDGSNRHIIGDVRDYLTEGWDLLAVLHPPCTLDGSTARDEIHKASPGPDRAARRSRFFPGLADAMADQWGGWAMQVAA